MHITLLCLLLLFDRRPYIREQLLKLRKEKFGHLPDNDGDDFTAGSSASDFPFTLDGNKIVLTEAPNPFDVSPSLGRVVCYTCQYPDFF